MFTFDDVGFDFVFCLQKWLPENTAERSLLFVVFLHFVGLILYSWGVILVDFRIILGPRASLWVPFAASDATWNDVEIYLRDLRRV